MNKTLLLAGAAVFCATAANAAELTPYAAARLSYMQFNNEVNQWVDDRGDRSVIADRTLKDETWSGKLALGARFNSNLRAELEYTYMDDTHNSGSYGHNISGFSIPTNYDIESKIQAVMINAYYDFKTNTRFTPYVSAGIGYARIKETASVANQYAAETASDSENNLAWSLGFGTSYQVSDNIEAELGYRYTDYGDKKGSEVRGYYQSAASRDYAAHEIILGVRYAF